MWHGSRRHSWRCAGLRQLLECLPALGLLLREGFEAQLLLVVQVKERLMLGLVEDGEGVDNLG